MSEPPPPPPPKKGRPRRLSCPGCGGSIDVRANGISISAICASCGRTIDVATGDLKIIAEAQSNTRTPDIPIGTRGSLAGTEWEVVGYQVRRNPQEGWTWDEYLLFNPYRGFRFLAHDDEGWTLYCMLRQDIPDPSNIKGERHHYAGPETSQARTDYVLGEFYWRVRVGDAAQVEQYTSGSNLLVKETTGDEIVWSRGLQVSGLAVHAAFKLAPAKAETPAASPRQHTIGAMRVGLVALVILMLLYMIPLGRNASQLVFQQNYQVTAADRGKPIASAPFSVPGSGGNLGLDVRSPLNNNWLGLNLSLVGENGTPVFNASETLEYYSGYDSDGSWTEGSQSARILFRSIPGGTYRLLVEIDAGALSVPAATVASANLADIMAAAQGLPAPPARPAPPPPSVAFTIEARRHVPPPGLFWIALFLIVPYPLYRLFFKRGHTR